MKQRDQELKDIVTIADMALLLRLSRARFYQLVNQGVFPPPSRNPTTQRPFYDREQQRACLEIRRTNRGANGQPVLFYSRHVCASVGKRKGPRAEPRSPKKQTIDMALVEQLQAGLAQLGLAEVSRNRVRAAVHTAYPGGHETVELSDLLRTIYRELKRQKSQDNAAR